jgi:hypothetical protein
MHIDGECGDRNQHQSKEYRENFSPYRHALTPSKPQTEIALPRRGHTREGSTTNPNPAVLAANRIRNMNAAPTSKKSFNTGIILFLFH